jgi:hypothetical protein
VVGTSVGYSIPVGGLHFLMLCKWLDVITAFCIFAVFARSCKVGSPNPVWLPKKYVASSSSLVLGPFVRPWHPCWGGISQPLSFNEVGMQRNINYSSLLRNTFV